jgi:DNA-binding phage protein
MILQNENGLTRLKREYQEWDAMKLNSDMVRVSEPPPYGLSFTDPVFREELLAEIREFCPDILIIDPWNAVAKDDNAREYTAAFDSIISALPVGENRPAVGIVAHTRKPKSDERRIGGHQMMNLLAGSYVITSKPRSVFIMLSADDFDETDRRRVWFNPKNNNGWESVRSAWLCVNGAFQKVQDFDWDAFTKGPPGRETMREEFIVEALREPVDRKGAIARLQEASGLGRRACEKALDEKGKFSHLIRITDDGYYELK